MEEIIAQIKNLETLARSPDFRSIDRDLLLERIRDLYDRVLALHPKASSVPSNSGREELPEMGAQEHSELPTGLSPRPAQVYEPGAAALAHPESTPGGTRDIRRLISLNEQFGFVQDLFDGDSQQYHQVLERINAMETYELAVAWLEEQIHDPMQWKDQDPQVEAFYRMVHTLFSPESSK